MLTSKGFIIIPKSVSQKRIISNSQIFDFELSPEEMKEVRSPFWTTCPMNC